MKYEFVGGVHDGEKEIDIGGPQMEPGTRLVVPYPPNLIRSHLYILTADGKFHFIKYSNVPMMQVQNLNTPEMLETMKKLAPLLDQLYKNLETLGGFPPSLSIGKWQLTVD